MISHERFEESKSVDELAHPVEAAEFAFAVLSPTMEPEQKGILLLQLEIFLSERYSFDHSAADMDRAITILDMVVEMSIVGAESKYPILALCRAFPWSSMTDQLPVLDRIFNMVEKFATVNPTDKVACMFRWGWSIGGRSQDTRLGREMTQRILDTCPPGHPARHGALLCFASFAIKRFRKREETRR